MAEDARSGTSLRVARAGVSPKEAPTPATLPRMYRPWRVETVEDDEDDDEVDGDEAQDEE